MKKKIIRRSALCSAILLSLGSVQGATILVGDGFNGCTLQDAIVAANTDAVVNGCSAGSGSDTLQMSEADSNIFLSTSFEASSAIGNVGLPIISSVISIEGDGLTIEVNNSLNNFRVFEVVSGGDLTLTDTTITGADDGYGLGSGIFSDGGRVTLEGSTIEENHGGLFLAGTLGHVISDSVIRNNFINSPQIASGIQSNGTGLSINNSSITGNHLESGVGPGPILRRGGLPSGGALGLFQSQVTVTNSTISGNSGYLGGGISIYGYVYDDPKRINNRRFGLNGGGGSNTSETTLTNNTITNNNATFIGGIIDYADGGTITMQGNILSGNSDVYSDYTNLLSAGNSTFNLDGSNIIGDNGDAQVRGVALGASDLTFSNATSDNLYPLIATNGQLVHPLKIGSLAIDAMPLSCFGLTTDQEGKGRGKDGNNDGTFVCDIGALENAKPILVNDAPCNLVNAVNSANSDSSVGGCQPGNGHDIIVLEENSLHSLDAVNYSIYEVYNFGLPLVNTGITLAGNGGTIEKADSYLDPLDVVLIAGGDLTLSDVTVTKADGVAAVFPRFGDATLLNAKVINNQSIGFASLYGDKTAVYNSTISGNINLGSNVDSAPGGLLLNMSNNFRIKNSTISDNTSGEDAGIAILSSSGVEILNSTISGNTATTVGAIAGNGGVGGILIESSNVTLKGLTVTNNAAEFLAGGLVVTGNAPNSITQLERSIISGNVMVPTQVTMDQNQLSVELSSLLFPQGRINNLRNSGTNRGILVDEVAVTGNAGSIEVDARNIFGQNNDSGTTGFTVGTSDVIPTGATSSVIETTLADNGGNTLTHNPVLSGPAVDNAGGCEETTDQVGNIRYWNVSTNSIDSQACDIGAVELNSIPLNDIIFKDDFEGDVPA